MDIKKLEQTIDNLESICSEGKRDIKKVLEVALNVKFNKVPELKEGQVYLYKNKSLRFLIKKNNKLQLVDSNFKSMGFYPERYIDKGAYKFLANNLKELIAKGDLYDLKPSEDIPF